MAKPTTSTTRAPKAKPSSSSTSGAASSSKPASKPKSAAVTKGTKRVRVVEPEDEAELVESTEVVAAAVAKKGKKDKDVQKPDTSRKDLKDKEVAAISPIVSKLVPAPEKGALKKGGKKAAAKAVEVPLVEEAEEAREDDEAEVEEEIDFLQGFESDDGEDSSDEEMETEATGGAFNISSLPTVNADEGSVQKKLEAKAERRKNAKTGTIYLGRIPHGFHEEEMRAYFSQFGEITRLRLSRNKTSGASKHYAFLEFAYASVAAIVQETMDNYLLAGHILVCKVVPDAEIHPKMWVGANRTFRVVPKGRRDRVRREAPKSEAQTAALQKRLLKREAAKRAQLATLGIEYDFAGYAQKEVASAVEDKVVEKKGAKKDKVVKEKKVKKSDEPAKKKARKSM